MRFVMKYLKKNHIGLVLIALILSAKTTPFSSHPSKPFLIQDSVAQIHGANRVIGDYSLLSLGIGTTNKINEVVSSSNFDVTHVYALVYGLGTVVRIGNDSKAEPLRFPTSCLRTMFARSHMSQRRMMNRAELSSKQNNLMTIKDYYERNIQSNYNRNVIFRI
ncbi:MAG: hypothetical protein ACI9YO_003287 [Gammaproteobacteria bacterium]|jgi:hypothetical protein